MASAAGRTDAVQLAADWIDRAVFHVFWIEAQVRVVLIDQAALFLLMGYDTIELRVWRSGPGRLEVVPLSLVSDGV